MAYFTHYWNKAENEQFEGEAMDHIASNQFRRRGVRVGDTVYCVSRVDGQFVVVGRLTVGQIVDGTTAADLSDQSEGYTERADHCIAVPGSGTVIDFGRVVPFDVAMTLRFNGEALTVDSQNPSQIDRQTLRGIRKIDPESAAILDRYIDTEGPAAAETGMADVMAFEEGSRVPAYHLRLERDGRIVSQKKREVMAATGRLACECCAFDFAKVYGEIGDGFAECHHRIWLSQTPDDSFRLTRTADLAIVCANCHRMLHRDQQMTVEGLRELVEQNRRGRAC